jgi:hypothetical protein
MSGGEEVLRLLDGVGEEGEGGERSEGCRWTNPQCFDAIHVGLATKSPCQTQVHNHKYPMGDQLTVISQWCLNKGVLMTEHSNDFEFVLKPQR